MPPRRRRLALLLVTAVATMALSTTAAGGGTHPSPLTGTDAAFAGDGRVDAVAARITGADRRDAPQRTSAQRFVLLALAAALLALHAFGRPRALRFDQPGPLRVSLWSPSVGRAPPFLQLAIA